MVSEFSAALFVTKKEEENFDAETLGEPQNGAAMDTHLCMVINIAFCRIWFADSSSDN